MILFAPGAGLPSTSPWMTQWAERLRTLAPVTPFDYPYQRAGRKRPDRHDVLVDAHREALRAVREARGDGPVVLVGKSMGSRIGCHLAVEDPSIAAVVCFGYPLISQSGAVRDQVLLALRRPVLFVQGTRDPLCPLPALAEVRARMTAPTDLWVVEAGDHSLQVTAAEAKRTSQADHDAQVLARVGAFLTERAPTA
ncbi:MAG: alpha/beta fold hydrolase [Myxococcota bacterium]